MVLPPETAHPLNALEAFLDAPPLHCYFRCIRCHNHLAFDFHFIQDLRPFSMTQLLFEHGVNGVMHRPDDYPIRGVYVGERPAGSHADVVPVYCTSCGAWLGWTIIWQYDNHFEIREGRFVLICGGGRGIEAVFVPL